MKITDIQIGDLLQCDENPCGGHRVDYLSEVDCEIGADGEIYGLEHLFPIPLTPEILQKNGGVKDYDVDGGYIVGNSIGLWFVDGEFEYANITVRYVHEFQHLLRLCGLNELADNFKV